MTEILSSKSKRYCSSLTSYSRFITREVSIGDIPLGGSNPIRIQSMTTTDTMDTEGTIEQSIRMIEAGSEYVRITAPSINEAKNLENIKAGLRKKGYNTPLIADIHFTPNAAEMAARIVEKVRVNPGNYADKKKFQIFNYTDSHYLEELERIRAKFTPLVKICKEYGTAMRIGTNHGSLSDRIMSRYGDTPLGMVESALEFVRICEDEGYYNIVLSMKASNPKVMVEAYRLLVNKMIESGMNYPLHLGVTEAGDGEDGRIKSAIGIGTLLEDGLGDTIRVSLTEEPEAEIPVCKKLAARYASRKSTIEINDDEYPFDPFTFNRRKTNEVINIGAKHVPVVVLNGENIHNEKDLISLGYKYNKELDKWEITDSAADYIFKKSPLQISLPGTFSQIVSVNASPEEHSYQLIDIPYDSHNPVFIELNDDPSDESLLEIRQNKNAVIVLTCDKENRLQSLRLFFFRLLKLSVENPVIVKLDYDIPEEEFMLYSSIDAGGLLLDGFGDGIWLENKNVSNERINSISFSILQSTRTRISKTEYISCPSCGRTLFDLQETTQMIRSRTNHLKGVKIAIMGCIVNGPGEMADADYGYVGSGPGKITLYKGKEVVKRGIPSQNALDELIGLIKNNGDWVETS